MIERTNEQLQRVANEKELDAHDPHTFYLSLFTCRSFVGAAADAQARSPSGKQPDLRQQIDRLLLP